MYVSIVEQRAVSEMPRIALRLVSVLCVVLLIVFLTNVSFYIAISAADYVLETGLIRNQPTPFHERMRRTVRK